MSDNDETPLEIGEPTPSGQQSGPDVVGAALEALSASEDAEIRAAAAADEQIAVELAELQAVAAELALIVPLRQINRGRSAGIRSRLVSRAMASRDGRQGVRSTKVIKVPSLGAARSTAAVRPVGSARGAQPSEPSLPHTTHATHMRAVAMTGSRQFNWLGLMAGFAFLLTGIGLVRVVRDRDHIRAAVASQQATLAKQVSTLEASIASKDSLIISLTGPSTKVVDLVNYASQDPLARMFWDQKTQEWTMYAYNLRQPKPGKVFQVWLITNAKPRPISAGTFTPDAHGSAVLHARYTLNRKGLEKVTISEEPAGGVPYPTGPIIIAGTTGT